MLRSIKQHRVLVSLPVIALVVGTVGFMILERLSFADALYFTVVTISTVGYGDIYPVSEAGRILSVVLIVFGIGAFLSIITRFTQSLVQRGFNKMRRNRLNMLIGIFYTEIGDQLLRFLVQYDAEIESLRQSFLVDAGWTPEDFALLRKKLQQAELVIDPALVDLVVLKNFLREKGEILIRLIENPDMIAHESFTELLWAVVHLRDELMARNTLVNLPATDIDHLAVDSTRAYILLTKQWIQHLQYLKWRYPYLFSLALRTNPFVENPSPIVE